MTSSAPTQFDQSAATLAPGHKQHLRHLDGIRGLAALYVLLEHVQLSALGFIGADKLSATNATTLQHFARLLNTTLAGFGHAAVDVFIVLSGYCLMLPVMQSADRTLRGGVCGYLTRRAFRILPPYYAALTIILLVEFIVSGIHRFSEWQVLSHIFMVHNLMPQWVYSVSAPMWSVAVEWQIYFAFALLLLPVWRKAGNVVTIVFALIIGLTPVYALPREWNFGWSCPWYVVLFSLGMVAATSYSNPSRRSSSMRPGSWALLAIAFSILTALLYLLQDSISTREQWNPLYRTLHRASGWPVDVMAGVAISCMFLSLAGSKRALSAGFNRPILSFLESTPIGRLGDFSYSLYLINGPILGALLWALQFMPMRPLTAYIVVWFTAMPLCLVGGYLFYLAVERRCIKAKRANTHINRLAPGQSAVARSVSPDVVLPA